MKFLVNFLLFAITVSTTLYSQHRVLRPADLVAEAKDNLKSTAPSLFGISNDRESTQLPRELTDYTLLTLRNDVARELMAHKNPFITLSIPQSGREQLILELVEVNIFAEGFTLVEAPAMTPVKAPHGKHYRGIVKDKPGSVATLSVFDGEVMGFVSVPEANGNLVIGKLSDTDQHIVYSDVHLAGKFDMACSTEDTGLPYTRDQLSGMVSGQRSLTDCTRLYLEVDYDIFVNKGSSTSAVNTFITGVFNQVSALYANEQINTVISEMVIWTQASPYNSTSSSGMLNAFTAYRQGFNGDLAQLLSYKASGGIAYVDGLCRTNPDYSMSYAGIQSTYQNVPTYSWTVEVCTHEFGHLFGSQHTHACAWNGNGTAIDGCYTTEGGCANPGLPSGGGTIMSYCHLTAAGINFANGFGPQPGNVIRAEVTAATCLQACSGGGGGGGGGSQCNNISLTMELKTDNYPGETTWNIKNSTGATLYSGGPYNVPNTLNTISLCLPAGCYTFTINDSYGDGICCSFGSGYYNIRQGTTTLISGGQFGAQEVKSFCASGTTPTCTDGVQNGQETGVDCGGPNCPACPTCTDGIQNGQETGVDCGGPNCPACPTCTDGIQNGQETGVDCGGPNCPPCSGTGQVQETTIAGNYFETGWEGWIDGGLDCARAATSSSPEGVYSIRLRDNSADQSAMTSQVYNFSQYDSVTVEFKFRAIGFEADEDFFFLYGNGTTWTTVATLSTPAHFINNTLYTRKYKLTGPLSSTSILKLQADASDDTDQVYIDAVVIKGYKTVTGATCTDGIQNGQETGIDCGGPLCPACPTCTDGIQNGTETGIDCGGSCAACPTCNDGIQNGNETGIDCGGSCSPCGNGNSVTISGSYFESGWDGWVDGGTDSYRYQGSLSAEGIYSIRIRDNSYEQSAMTSPAYNLTPYNGISVEFKFIADGMEPGEDFWLQYFNGISWSTVATLVSGNHFVNNQFYTVTVNLTGSFGTASMFRLMCDASENDDNVYIDAVIIRGNTGSSLPADSIEISALPLPIEYDRGIDIYPNPVQDRLTVRTSESVTNLRVYSASGLLMLDSKAEDNTADLSVLPAGMYLVRIETAENVYNTRIVKL